MVLKREEAIKRLLAGERLYETALGGYSYRIRHDTVRFETARYLIKEGLVSRVENGGLHHSYRATDKLKARDGVALEGGRHALF